MFQMPMSSPMMTTMFGCFAGGLRLRGCADQCHCGEHGRAGKRAVGPRYCFSNRHSNVLCTFCRRI